MILRACVYLGKKQEKGKEEKGVREGRKDVSIHLIYLAYQIQHPSTQLSVGICGGLVGGLACHTA